MLPALCFPNENKVGVFVLSQKMWKKAEVTESSLPEGFVMNLLHFLLCIHYFYLFFAYFLYFQQFFALF